MSKLKKAPLIEVIFELRWAITNSDDLARSQYLYGDLYNELKSIYPFRESIVPAEVPIDLLINKPVHRFRNSKDEYPLCQIGPGLITHNTIDKKYYWETFSKNIIELVDAFINVFPEKDKQITTSLLYIDLIPFDFSKDNVNNFLNENFNIDFKQSFLDGNYQPYELNFGFYYKTKFGNLELTFRRGSKNINEEGILIQTRLNAFNLTLDKNKISVWLNNAHNSCSTVFKKLVSTKLYNSFNSGE